MPIILILIGLMFLYVPPCKVALILSITEMGHNAECSAIPRYGLPSGFKRRAKDVSAFPPIKRAL